MRQIQRILCPIDFSTFSRRAFDHAVAIARWYQSSITVMHVVPVVAPMPMAPLPVALPPIEWTEDERSRLLDDIRRFIQDEGTQEVMCVPLVRQGEAALEIITEAGTMGADLVVMGSHGRTGFDRLLLGSVAERVVRKVACPVLIVPPHAPDAVPASPVVFKRILCAVDFSECSLYALEYAMSLAQEADGQLTIAHAVTRTFESISTLELLEGATTVEALQQRREASALRRLEDLVPRGVAFCEVEAVVEPGRASDAILQLAADRQVDLIVLGVQGHGAARRAIFGSTTQDVMRHAVCPVLAVHPPHQG